jgi:hypothetical protein
VQDVKHQPRLGAERPFCPVARHVVLGPGQDSILPSVSSAVDTKKCQIESGQLSPDGQKLALAVEIKSMLRLRTQHAAMLYSFKDNAILGRIAVVKRDGRGGFRKLRLRAMAIPVIPV